jgi:uncharacterized protein YjeT (DUF2065 family)
MELFLCVIGMVLVVEGLPYLAFPDKMKEFMRVMRQQDDTMLRVGGAVITLLGLLIIFLARKWLASS